MRDPVIQIAYGSYVQLFAPLARILPYAEYLIDRHRLDQRFGM